MAMFDLEIVTPGRHVLSESVQSLLVPTPMGNTGVLPRHEPLFSLLTEGEIIVHSKIRDYYLVIGGGFMEITGGRVQILVSRAAHADELNEEEIKKARESAKVILSHKVVERERGEAQALLRRTFLELKVLVHRRRIKSGLPTESS